MSDKTFKARIREEVADFPDIYAEFYDDYKLRSDEGLVESIWLHLFAVPFDGYLLHDQPNEDAKRKLKASDKHDAVKKAVQILGVHNLRLGALEIKDSRVVAALEGGLLTPDDLAPPSTERPGEFERLVQRRKPDHSDPFFWRTLIEVFCRALVAPRGPRPWSLIRIIDLAFDLDEIRRNKARWNRKEVLSVLRKEPYRSRYPAPVGKDRIEQITRLIEPMDDDALVRLKNLFPDAFFRVVEMRSRRQRWQRYNTTEILNMAEDLGDALSAASLSKRPRKRRVR